MDSIPPDVPPGQQRFVIQIAANDYALYCLCSDGTVWQRGTATDAPWVYVPNIPQDSAATTIDPTDRYVANRMGWNTRRTIDLT